MGRVQLVISFATAERAGTAILLLTNRLDGSVQKILTTSLQRWPTETLPTSCSPISSPNSDRSWHRNGAPL